mgnify:CR=1 FL=1|jgi:hypothetical protein
MAKSVFETLNKIDVNEHTEKKGNLTYLSWAWAWAEVKKKYPDANYLVHENKDEWNYFTDGRSAWVKTSVTIDSISHTEMLPVLDFKNKSIPLDKITSFNVNTAIQRSLTKAIARHGLGLYIYAGEDLPDLPIWENDALKDKYLLSFKELIGESEFGGIKELWKELTKRQQNDIWKDFDNQEKIVIKEAFTN